MKIATTVLLLLLMSKPVPQATLVEPGDMFHGNEIPENVAGKWLALKKIGSTYQWTEVVATSDFVHDPIVDQDPDRKSGRSITVADANAIRFMVRDLESLKNKKVTFVAADVVLGQTPVGLKLGQNIYSLSITKHDAPSDALLVFRHGPKEQVLYDVPSFDDLHWEILWAGDLDEDGKLDLYLSLNSHYNEVDKRLFLSSTSRSGELVRKVATWRTTGC